MARLSFGYMVLLLTCSKIASANVLPAPNELNEKLNLNGESDSTDRGPSQSIVPQNGNANKLAKRNIDPPRNNWIADNNYYNPTFPRSAAEVPPHPYSFFSLLQPQTHQIQRPYYIPVIHIAGGSTIILSPQPLYINFEHPPDNPPKEYKPNNSYLPPDNPAPQPCPNNTQINLDSKFIVNNSPVPTRKPGRPTTPPSLIHNENDEDSTNQLPNSTPSTTTTTTAAARPSPPRVLPSKCVWSISSCCNSKTSDINYRCFEQLGCEGAFWDGNPCDTKFAAAAIELINKYYNTQ